MHQGANEEPDRKRLIVGYLAAAVLVVASVAGIIVVVANDGDSSAAPVSSASAEAFAPVYDGLDERRIAAGVPTMGEGGGEHFHPNLEIYVRGDRVDVPANIGIDPVQPPMAGLHTHDTSGTIHNEAGTGATLGQFFAVWGVPFSPTQLGPYEAKGDESVQMWVDGEESEAFGDLELADGQQIVVAYGSDGEVPDGLSASR